MIFISYYHLHNLLDSVNILVSASKTLLHHDTNTLNNLTKKSYIKPSNSISTYTDFTDLLSIDVINEKIKNNLIGHKLEYNDTKTRGQSLERLVATLLGYSENDKLFGGYPDIPNQLLEIKVQDSSTVDLGKSFPAFKEVILQNDNITTKDIRYLIALTNSETGIIEGIVLTPGQFLNNTFTYISDTNYKCQRSIPMAFFDKYKSKCVFNPQD